jgi:L-serine dehydratase
MVGPSSSHTAGAVRIGQVARRLLAAQPASAEILLHGSFAATGSGHGTDRALVAGLLGMAPDHPDIPNSFRLAQDAGMEISIRSIDLRDAHPNTAVLKMTRSDGRTLEIRAASLGGGRIRVESIDGMNASFSGEYPTLIIRNEDKPGIVSEVSSLLSSRNCNIATMQLYRDRRGGLAVMVIECDSSVSQDILNTLENMDGIVRCTYLDTTGG